MSDDLDIKAEIEAARLLESENGQFTTEEAEAILQRERANRANRCLQEVNAALQKHHCHLATYVILRAGEVVPHIEIVAD